MAVIQLYQFVSNKGYSYKVQYNEETDVVFVDTDAELSDIEQGVTLLEIAPHTVNEVLYDTCTPDKTRIVITPMPLYPFARRVRTINSPNCGYVAGTGTCNWIPIAIVADHETVVGRRDGKVTILITLNAGDSLLYSLDNVTWQTSNMFVGLMPGNYKYYVKGANNNCTYSGVFSIAAGRPATVAYYPWQERICFGFRLIQDGVVTNIREPLKWDQVRFKCVRDPDTHTWTSMYSDGVIELQFGCDQSVQVLTNEKDKNGVDGDTTMEYGYIFNNDFVYILAGKIDYNTYHYYPGYVTASLVQIDYNNNFTNRFDTQVKMTAATTIDGLPVTPPVITPVILHSKALIKQFTAVNDPENVPEVPGVGDVTYPKLYLIPDTSNVTANEIEDSFGYGLNWSPDAPYDVDLYNQKLKYGGVYSYVINYNIDLKHQHFHATQPFTVRNYFMVNDVKTQVGADIIGVPIDGEWKITNVNYAYDSGPLTLAAGDRIFWFSEITYQLSYRDGFGGNHKPWGYNIAVLQNSVSVSVTGSEVAAASSANGWLIFDALNHILRVITENRTSLRSNFLTHKGPLTGTDGEGALTIVTNGFQIRNYSVQANPLSMSAKDCLNSLIAENCLGYNFEKFSDEEVLRVERVDYFYQNKKIVQIDEIVEGSYHEDVAKEKMYNSFEIGYDKYQTDGSNTLDEFNTYKQGLTPVKASNVKLSQKSGFIRSGYSLEEIRRQQYNIKPSDSVTNDEAIFAIEVKRNPDNSYQAERNEAFDIVQNVISPETSYNLRKSPTRLFVNWAIWLKNFVFWKQPVDKFTTTLNIQNGTLITKLKTTDQRPIGDIYREQWQENAAIAVGDYPVSTNLLQPDYIYFQAQVTPDIVIKIDNAMRNADTEQTNYGFILVKDDKGNYRAGYPMELEYDYSTQMATFKLFKAYNDMIAPDEICCNYLSYQGCNILFNGQKMIV